MMHHPPDHAFAAFVFLTGLAFVLVWIAETLLAFFK